MDAAHELEVLRNLNRIGLLSPHFVSNNLMLIEQLGKHDQKGMRQAIQKFAQYTRDNNYVMTNPEPAPLSEEIARIENYMVLEHANPYSLIQAEFDISPEAASVCVPPLTVQPLFESSVRHGVGTQTEGGRVAVAARVEGANVAEAVCGGTDDPDGRTLIITIADNGRPFTPPSEQDASSPFSLSSLPNRRAAVLSNVKERLRLTCNGTIDLTSGDEGTTITIAIPLKS